MTEQGGHPAGWERYTAQGLVANPYDVSGGNKSESVGIRASVRAAALGLIGGVEEALRSERPKPVRVLKSSDLPSYYPRSAMTVALRELGADTHTGMLTAYVPLIMMRKGRIRGTLSVIAEMVSGRSVDITLGRYTAKALAEADTALPEWEPMGALDLARIVAEFEDDPQAAVARVLGAPVELRDEDSERALEEIMRDSGMRQAHQPADPSEDDDTAEESALDALVAEVESEKALTEAEGEEEVEEESDPEEALIARYVVAHARKHVSPVIARAIRAYVESGTAAMSQELKITKAPRKTLNALAAFARLTYRSIVIVYDGFEAWSDIPDDLQVTIVSGLSEVRFALGGNGVIVIAGSDKEEPAIDDQFANAVRVSWEMSELPRVEKQEAALDIEALEGWLHAAALPGADVSGLWKRVVDSVESAADLASGLTIASDIVEQAAGSES